MKAIQHWLGIPVGLALALLLAAPAVQAQDVCDTTPLAQCTSPGAVGDSVSIEIGGPGAEDGDGNGGTCVGVDASALLTFTKTSGTTLQVDLANTTAVADISSITAIFFNIEAAVSALGEDSPFTDPDPHPPLPADPISWNLDYNQTTAANDGNGIGADGFGHFDAAIFNGDNASANGGDPGSLVAGDSIRFFVDVTTAGGDYDLCSILSSLSQPPPGEMNRVAAGRFQSCGVNGDSAFIGPCTPDDDLLAVISDLRTVPSDKQVRVEWDTSLEIDNAGFNVLRREKLGGQWEYVNADFIPGAGDSVSGASYAFDDRGAVNGVEYQYKIEDVDFQGRLGLSQAADAVPNPLEPTVDLVAPAYGTRVSLEGLTLTYNSSGRLRGSGVLQFSADPGFGSEVVSASVPVRPGTRDFTPNPHTLAQIEAAAAGSDGILYWRVADRNSNPVSQIFRMEVE